MAQQSPLFSVVARTNLASVAGKPTKECFTSQRYGHRDDNLTSWFPENQPGTGASTITALAPTRGAAFVEWAAEILGVNANTENVTLGNLLKREGYTMTFPQIEEMVDAAEREIQTGMDVGRGSFFFSETGDRLSPVSMCRVYRNGRDWYAHAFRLNLVFIWNVDSRLFVPDLRLEGVAALEL